jgi:hypothetical protein
VDGQMVSARAWPDYPAWMREFVRLLKEGAPRRAPSTQRRSAKPNAGSRAGGREAMPPTRPGPSRASAARRRRGDGS